MSTDEEKKRKASERNKRYYAKNREKIIARVIAARDRDKKQEYDRERYNRLKGAGEWKSTPPSQETKDKNKVRTLARYHANKEAINERRRQRRAMAKAQVVVEG
jgi:hypothetical protein